MNYVFYQNNNNCLKGFSEQSWCYKYSQSNFKKFEN